MMIAATAMTAVAPLRLVWKESGPTATQRCARAQGQRLEAIVVSLRGQLPDFLLRRWKSAGLAAAFCRGTSAMKSWGK